MSELLSEHHHKHRRCPPALAEFQIKAQPRMSLNCPTCNREVYSRRHKRCGFCGAELPAEFLFTEAELALLDAEAEQRRQERRDREEKAAKEAAEAARWANDVRYEPPLFP